jgi:hypothetical protein
LEVRQIEPAVQKRFNQLKFLRGHSTDRFNRNRRVTSILLRVPALLFPGTLARRDSLAVGGNESVRLLVGVIPMLIVAGTIEGFFSPSSVSTPFKFTLAAALFTMFVAYLSRGWRKQESLGSIP